MRRRSCIALRAGECWRCISAATLSLRPQSLQRPQIAPPHKVTVILQPLIQVCEEKTPAVVLGLVCQHQTYVCTSSLYLLRLLAGRISKMYHHAASAL